MTSSTPAPLPGDDRDWTFVITEGCPECGFQPFPPADTAVRIAAGTQRWRPVLTRPDVTERPSPEVWSPLEYACHMRDMVRLLGTRVAAMRDDDQPVLTDWDGDAKAVELHYWSADPASTWEELEEATERTVGVLDSVGAADLQRGGVRSDGAVFTIASLGQYIAHEMEHHLHDVGA